MIICVVHGLEYLHARSIIHRDIKPDNIFRMDGEYKIGDLNVSKLKSSNRQELTQVGTPSYASPEIWENANYDNKCDVWSLGCVAYEMAMLSLPFVGRGMAELYT
jgi:NIMA (never in mitosis gene a)-related kinase